MVSIWAISVLCFCSLAHMAMVISRLKAAQQGTRSSFRQKTLSMRQAAKVSVSRVFTVKRPFKRSPRLSSIRLLPSRAEISIASTWLKTTSLIRFSGTRFRANRAVTPAQMSTTSTLTSSAACNLPMPISDSS